MEENDKKGFVPTMVVLVKFDTSDITTTSNPNAFDTRGDEDDFTLEPRI